MIKKYLLSLLLAVIVQALTPVAYAGVEDCVRQGQCVDNLTCYRRGSLDWELKPPTCNSAVIGSVEPPQGVANFNETGFIGVVYFMNRAIVLITVIAGIFVMFNFIRAGWMFLLAGGDTKATAEVRDLLTYSVIGLVIIAVAYTIAGLIGLIFFGDASYILNPQLESAVSTP